LPTQQNEGKYDSQPVIDLYAYEKLSRTDNFSHICLFDGV